MKNNNIPACVNKILKNNYGLKILSSIFLGIQLSEINSVSYIHGCINVYTDKSFYKLQLCGKGLELDIINRDKIYREMREDLYPIQILNKRLLCIRAPLCIRGKILDEHIEKIVCDFRKNSRKVRFDYRRYYILKAGLERLDKCKNGIKARNLVCKYFERNCREYVHEGIVHGDFHSGNILFRNNEELVMIDFDCSRLRDIQEVDILYYYLQEAVSKYKNMLMWQSVWMYIFANISQLREVELIVKYIKMDLNLAWIILFIERIGQEDDRNEEYGILNRAVCRIINYIQKLND